MSKHIHASLLTLFAAVLFGASACSTSPIEPDSALGQATDSMAGAGSRLWAKTKHVFRMDDAGSLEQPADNAHTEITTASELLNEIPDEYRDEVDLALVRDELPADTNSDIAITDESAVTLANTGETDLIEIHETVQQETIQIAAADLTESAAADPQVIQTPSAIVELEHIVQDNENLWQLSKRLTGDATNWRVLAELNGLDENGTVFPGQILHVPADLANGAAAPALAAANPAADVPTTSELSAAEIKAVPQGNEVAVAKASAVETVTEIVATDNTVAPPSNVPTTAFEVQAGETMWDLAKRTTGDATNWQAIAAANEMTNKEAAFIKYGESIGVPTDLLKSGAKADSAVAEAAPKADTANAEVIVATKERVEIPETPIKVAEEIVVAAADKAAPAEGDVKIMPAKFTAEPPVIPDVKQLDVTTQVATTQTEVLAVAAAMPKQDSSTKTEVKAVEGDSGEWVMVSGTYYPKAIYNDANFSAPLLMRVSPGTKLKVARAIGPWFEVKTDRGVGYVHSRDIK